MCPKYSAAKLQRLCSASNESRDRFHQPGINTNLSARERAVFHGYGQRADAKCGFRQPFGQFTLVESALGPIYASSGRGSVDVDMACKWYLITAELVLLIFVKTLHGLEEVPAADSETLVQITGVVPLQV